MREAEFADMVAEMAAWGGWLRYHTFDSRRSAAGFPDEVLVHPGRRRIVFAELKAQKGKVRPEQALWLDALDTAATGAVSVHLWRPSDLDQIERLLLPPKAEKPSPEGGGELLVSDDPSQRSESTNNG